MKLAEEKKGKKKSIIVISGSLGAVVFCLIAGFTGNPEFLYALGIILLLLILDKFIITPFHYRLKLHEFINKNKKPINYISFSIFIFLIILIVLFKFVL